MKKPSHSHQARGERRRRMGASKACYQVRGERKLQLGMMVSWPHVAPPTACQVEALW